MPCSGMQMYLLMYMYVYMYIFFYSFRGIIYLHQYIIYVITYSFYYFGVWVCLYLPTLYFFQASSPRVETELQVWGAKLQQVYFQVRGLKLNFKSLVQDCSTFQSSDAKQFFLRVLSFKFDCSSLRLQFTSFVLTKALIMSWDTSLY